MSTSPTFVVIGYWPSDFCGNYPQSKTYFDGSSSSFDWSVLVGPYTLEQAMQRIWNCEALQQTTSIDSVSSTYGGSTQPNNRICSSVSVWNGQTSGAVEPSRCTIFPAVFTDNSDNYFIPFTGFSVSANSGGEQWIMQLYPYMFPDRILDHTFQGTIDGISVTVYCARYLHSGETWPYSDTYNVTLSYWTY